MRSEIFYALSVQLFDTIFAVLISDNGGSSNNNDDNNSNDNGHIHHPYMFSLYDDPSVLRFGNLSASDYFKLLDSDGDYLLIGARDFVYNISVQKFTASQSIKWLPKHNAVNECLMKGKPKDACHNYIRVLAKSNGSNVLICGTNAFQPMCRIYEHESYGEYREDLEFSGLGIAPYDPEHNSTFLRDGDLLYAGTVSDFSGADPLIHRQNVTKIVNLGIRTRRNDVKFLNEPHFVGSFRDEEYVYIWFREHTIEHEGCNGGTIQSRIARLCRSDNGGPKPYSNEWTSFVKARLNCSIPGHYPFYFDQIEAIAPPISGQYFSRNEKIAKLVYAVFRSPLAGISSSAICAFNVQQINDVFSKSTYGSRSSMKTSWMNELKTEALKHRPGKCVNNSKLLSEEAIAFARSNSFMDKAIPNYFGAPIAIHSGTDHFTQIAIDPQVKTVDGHLYDVMFVGTDKGNVFKMVNLADTQITTKRPSHHIYTLQVTNEPVRNMMMYQSSTNPYPKRYLIVVSSRSVIRIPIAQCHRFNSCTECVALRDPHCAWDVEIRKCVLFNNLDGTYEQNIITGRAEGCGIFTEFHPFFNFDATHIVNERKPLQGCASGTNGFSTVTAEPTYRTLFVSGLSISVICAGIAAFSTFFGFFIGNLYCHWKLPKKAKSSPCPSFSTNSQPCVHGSRLSSPPLSIINAYASTPKYSITVPPRPESPISLIVEDLSNSSLWETSTLPSNYRVKQIYL